MLHFVHSFLWCSDLDTSESRLKYVENSEVWCWRRIEKISWNDHVNNEGILLGINEERYTSYIQ